MPIERRMPNPDLLDRIPPGASTVLEVGCGDGGLGEAYRRRNPRCRYLGIEGDPAAAKTAALALSEVLCVDVEREPLPFGPGPFDCIVFGDILEHLSDPWSLLQHCATTLAEDGVMLLCVPNVEHWSFAARLLAGNWDYEPSGLLDHRHLRWFSKATIERALQAAGLAVVDVTPRIFPQEQAEAFLRAIAPALSAQGIDEQGYRQRALPLQYICRAMRTPPARLHLRASMLDHVGGVSHIRVVQPCRAMMACPGVGLEIVSVRQVAPGQGLALADDAPDTARIFVFHRPILAGDHGLAVLRELIAEGWLTICEFDDHPGVFPAMQTEELYSFQAVHAVQTSTERLARVFGASNPEIGVFPNAIQDLPAPANFQTPDRLTLLFAGINREQEWPPLIEAINSAAALAGERLAFRVIGDQGFFDALATPHKSFTPLCDYETYLGMLAQSEISFMPLRATEFNQCKSDLKFIEAAAHRVVALASPTVYERSLEDGRTGVIFRDPTELAGQLLRLLADPPRARAIGDAARLMVSQRRMLYQQAGERLAWYRSLWERREELHRALVARVPELADTPFGGARRQAVPPR